MKGNLDAGNYVPVALDLIALGSGMKSEPYQLGAYQVLQFLLENFLFHDFAVKHFLDGYRSVHFTFVPFYYRIFLHFCEIFFLMN